MSTNFCSQEAYILMTCELYKSPLSWHWSSGLSSLLLNLLQLWWWTLGEILSEGKIYIYYEKLNDGKHLEKSTAHSNN